jgi:hypothetical protein
VLIVFVVSELDHWYALKVVETPMVTLLLLQIVVDPVSVGRGLAFTVMVALAVAVQLLASVIVTVYIVVASGATLMLGFVSVLDQA